MTRTEWWNRGLVAASVGSLLFAIACSEDVPTSTTSGRQITPSEVDRSTILAAVKCIGSLADQTIACAVPEGTSNKQVPDKAASILVGGQDMFVSIKTSGANYNAGTGDFKFNTTIRNLIFQAMGTKDTIPGDGVDPDPAGVRIFFSSGPTVTSGTGVINVVPDGFATFTAANQPYYQYNEVLDPFELSAAKQWTLNMPSTVLTFSFILLVSAEVPRPTGYIDLDVTSVTPPTDRQMTYVVRNALGTIIPDPGPIAWSVSDTTRATIDGNGLINPLRAGTVTIIAQAAGPRVGYFTVTVNAIKRTWTGAVNTDWATVGNWIPDGIKPEPTDSALIDDVSASTYPILSANESVAGLEVLDATPGGTIPTVSLGAFNLTAGQDVIQTNSAFISSTSGFMILAGPGNIVNGTLPQTRVTGQYTLSGNLFIKSPTHLDLGRLNMDAYELLTDAQ